MIQGLRTLSQRQDLIRFLVTAHVKSMHKNTLLGYVWWVLDPLLLAAVFVLLVGVILGRGGPAFPAFILAAIIPWKFFSSSSAVMSLRVSTSSSSMSRDFICSGLGRLSNWAARALSIIVR